MRLYLRTARERAHPPTALLEPTFTFDLDDDLRAGVRNLYRYLRAHDHGPASARAMVLQITRCGTVADVDFIAWPRHPQHLRR